MTTTELLGWCAVGLFGLGIGGTSYVYLRPAPLAIPELGHLGLRRRRALTKNGLLRTLDPALRRLGRWIQALPADGVRAQLDRELLQAGDWLGLRAPELLALCVFSAVAGTVFAWFLVDSFEGGPELCLVGSLVGFVFPILRVRSAIKNRFTLVSRTLPGAIDLAALCMGAGLDFPGALRQLVDKAPNPEDPLVEELSRILQELDLGRTRAQALKSFAERVAADSVRDFVTAVIQSEEKGTPLAEVLRIQAAMLRTHRTVKAEESAAKAGVMMMLPLVMIFASIILLLAGPFVLKGMMPEF